MNILIAGLGSIGRRHLAAVREILPESRLMVLRHQKTDAEEETGVTVIHDMKDALSEGVDLAIVSNPATSHIETAMALAEHGAHLLIEKPLSLDMTGVDILIQTCQRKGVVLQVGYCLRYNPSFKALRIALKEGLIGKPLSLQFVVGQYLPDWRPGVDYRDTVSAREDLGGGVLLELSHEIDLARWLMGEVVSVSAITGRQSSLHIDVEDTADILLEFDNGIIGNLHLDMVQRKPVRTCKVVGSRGSLEWDGIRHRTIMYDEDNVQQKVFNKDGGLDRDILMQEQLVDFLECIETKGKPLVSGEDGKRAVEIVLAAKLSSEEGRTIRL